MEISNKHTRRIICHALMTLSVSVLRHLLSAPPISMTSELLRVMSESNQSEYVQVVDERCYCLNDNCAFGQFLLLAL
jgi:hypothetical protein